MSMTGQFDLGDVVGESGLSAGRWSKRIPPCEVGC